MSGVVAAAIVAHVPTLARVEITPPYQRTLVDAERALGNVLRTTVKPDLWVIVSTHWVSTFNWSATCQPMHDGVCVASEAPDLIPGSRYRYRGDPAFGSALVQSWNDAGIPGVRNESAHYEWDYGSFVPMQYLDPLADVPVVGVPVVLLADHDECLRAGAAIHTAAKALGKRVVLLASTALTHLLVRGRHHMPTAERVEADKNFIDLLVRGAIDEAINKFGDYSRTVAAEMGGRALATMLGAVRAMKGDGSALAAKQYGDYAQSSASGNVVVLVGEQSMISN